MTTTGRRRKRKGSVGEQVAWLKRESWERGEREMVVGEQGTKRKLKIYRTET